MASEEASNPASPTPSDSSNSSDSSAELPEALAFGREKRATAGNKLRALLDAEFQEEEIFKEDEDDEEFERQRSDEGEEYISESESSGDEDQQDEEEGERALIAEQKSAAKKSREKKRKATETFVKPVPKRRPPPKKELAPAKPSKPASTTSSLSNRRISFDPSLLAARRSSRALTVQTTNETQSRIISAAARRATLPVIPRREQTPPLTQEERLAQAKITEEENKMSLKRIVEAEEERARKRREKLEALRRRRFDEPLIRFISKRGSLIEEIPDEEEEREVIVDDVENGVPESMEGTVVKKEPTEQASLGGTTQEVKDTEEKPDGEKQSGVDGEKMDVDESNAGPAQANPESIDSPTQNVVIRSSPEVAKIQPPLTTKDTSASLLDEQMDVDHVEPSTENTIQPDSDTKSAIIPDATALVSPHSPTGFNSTEAECSKTAEETTPLVINPTTQETITENLDSEFKTIQPQVTDTNNQPSETTLQTPPHQTPTPPKTPPPYHEAHFTSNTLTYVPLPTQPSLPPTARETFFPNLPIIPPPKPKPSPKCPITGLSARYKDPLSGVGYYDIHAFKMLREVGRRGGRYVWCSEGGWFVGEMGWGGRGAKGVPEGWNG
jgi:vacuolar protein sorting-associated protein 72